MDKLPSTSFKKCEKRLREDYFNLGNEEDHSDWNNKCNNLVKKMKFELKKYNNSNSELLGQIERIQGLSQKKLSGGGLHSQQEVEWIDKDSALNKYFETFIIKNYKHVDPKNFFQKIRPLVINTLKEKLNKHLCAKVSFILKCEFVRGEKIDNFYSASKSVELLITSNLEEWYENAVKNISSNLEEFQERDSGWALSKILFLEINIAKCDKINGSGHVILSKKLKQKHALVNVETFMDEACFAWAVTSALYPAKTNVARISSYPHYEKVLNLEGIKFPMTLDQIDKFENLNNVSINVFSSTENDTLIYPLIETGLYANAYMHMQMHIFLVS